MHVFTVLRRLSCALFLAALFVYSSTAFAEVMDVDLNDQDELKLVGVEPGVCRMYGVTPVKISRKFYIAADKISCDDYEKVTGKKPNESGKKAVTGLTYDQMRDFCAKLTEKNKENKWVKKGYVFRLPTDAEWEYVCRGAARVQNMESEPKEMTTEPIESDYYGAVTEDPYENNMIDPFEVYTPGNFRLARTGKLGRTAVWYWSVNKNQTGFRVVLGPDLAAEKKNKKVDETVEKSSVNTLKVSPTALKHVGFELVGVKDKAINKWKWDKVKRLPEADGAPGAGKAGWKKGKDDAKRAALAKQLNEQMALFGAQRGALSSAADFPGIPEDGASIIRREMIMQTAVGGWHSTGTYALPGEPVCITISGTIPKNGYTVRIGCHTDGLNDGHETWNRPPKITRSQRITKNKTFITNPYGGLVYLDISPKKCDGKPIKVVVSNVVAAPVYILGVTDEKEWEKQLARCPAPWGEMFTPRLITSLPTSTLKKMPEIKAIAEKLENGMRTQDYLMGWDTVPEKTNHPMRFVVDRQISAGAGHSGYPFMAYMYWANGFTNGGFLRDGSWGIWHELGHNHQVNPYRFAGQGEITVNIYSMAAQTANGIPLERAWEGGGPRNKKELKAYFSNPTDIAVDDNNRGYKLTFYADLFEHLGIEVFRGAALAYLDHPYPDNYTNTQKYNFLLLEMSKAVKKNLTPYFKAWKIEIDPAVEAQIKDLPPWLPSENYPECYLK